MQVILTEEEYMKLKMDAATAKATAPDHVALQTCALQTMENFEEFAKHALQTYFEQMYFDTAPFFETISAYKREIQSHFVR